MADRNENVTPEGIEVRPGQVWRDLDARQEGRCVRVISVAWGKARVARTNPASGWTSDRHTTLSVRRMRKCSTGFALVPQAK